MAIIADVRTRGGKAVYLDPDADGHGGRCILLTDLFPRAAFESDTKDEHTSERNKWQRSPTLVGFLFAVAGLISLIAGQTAIGIAVMAIGFLFIGLGAGVTK